MPSPKKQYVEGRYGQMHLRIAAPEALQRKPLLCLHMFPQSGRNFEKFLEEASAERVVVAPDFPGYGESNPPPQPIRAEDYAQCIWETVDALSLTDSHDQIDLFGIHAGAKLAVELTRQRPQHIGKIVLSSAAVLYPDEVQKLREALTPIPLDDDGTRFVRLWRMLGDNRGPGVTHQMMATSLAEILRGGEHYGWGNMAVFDYNRVFTDVLKTLPHRISLLNPKDDLYEFTPRTLGYLQNGELLDRPEWSHGFLELHAAELARTVDKLLD